MARRGYANSQREESKREGVRHTVRLVSADQVQKERQRQGKQRAPKSEAKRLKALKRAETFSILKETKINNLRARKEIECLNLSSAVELTAKGTAIWILNGVERPLALDDNALTKIAKEYAEVFHDVVLEGLATRW